MFICRQKINFESFPYSWRYCKNIATSLFRVLEHARLCTPKVILSNCRKLLDSSAGKKSTSSPTFFLEILQRYVIFLLWVFWVCLAMNIQNDSINLYNIHSIFIFMPKIHFIIHFTLEIIHFKESCNLIDQHHIGHNSRTRIFPDMGLVLKYQ